MDISSNDLQSWPKFFALSAENQASNSIVIEKQRRFSIPSPSSMLDFVKDLMAQCSVSLHSINLSIDIE